MTAIINLRLHPSKPRLHLSPQNTLRSLPSLGTLGNSNRFKYRSLIASRLSCRLRRTFPNPSLTPLDFRWATGCACLRPSKADRRFAHDLETTGASLRRGFHIIFFHHLLLFRSRNYRSRQWFPACLKSIIDTVVRLSPNMSNPLSYYWKHMTIKSSGKRTRALNIRYFFLTDQVEKGNVTIVYCPTNDMVGDFHSKPLQGEKFQKFQNAILGCDY